jgi:hypothetical protein
MYSSWYIFGRYYVGWLPADLRHTKIYQLLYIQHLLMISKKCSKYVEAVNRNKLKVNSASCWSSYSEVNNC